MGFILLILHRKAACKIYLSLPTRYIYHKIYLFLLINDKYIIFILIYIFYLYYLFELFYLYLHFYLNLTHYNITNSFLTSKKNILIQKINVSRANIDSFLLHL